MIFEKKKKIPVNGCFCLLLLQRRFRTPQPILEYAPKWFYLTEQLTCIGCLQILDHSILSLFNREQMVSEIQKTETRIFFLFSNFVRRGLELKENMIVVFMDFSMSFFYWSIVLRYFTPYFFCSLSLVKFLGIM